MSKHSTLPSANWRRHPVCRMTGWVPPLTLLLVAVVVVVLGNNDEQDGDGLISVLADSNDLRMAKIQQRLDAISERLKGASGTIIDQSGQLHRIRALTGNGCPHKMFQCALSAAAIPQCISSTSVCDGFKHCKDGADESEITCANMMPVGSGWSGDIDWVGCSTISTKKVYLMVTGSGRPKSYLPHQIVGTMIFSRGDDSISESQEMRGVYDFSARTARLRSRDDAIVPLAFDCYFIDKTYCRAYLHDRYADWPCAYVAMLRT